MELTSESKTTRAVPSTTASLFLEFGVRFGGSGVVRDQKKGGVESPPSRTFPVSWRTESCATACWHMVLASRSHRSIGERLR